MVTVCSPAPRLDWCCGSSGLPRPRRKKMRVMKFITLATILLAISFSSWRSRPRRRLHRQARSHDQRPVQLGQTNVQHLLRRMSRHRRLRQRPSRLSPEDSTHRPYWAGAKEWRQISVRPRRFGHPRAGRASLRWQSGHASLGTAVLQHQPGASEIVSAKQSSTRDWSSRDQNS
jgi:hypothetical protein